MKKLGKLLTAMVTPFDKNQNVDYEKAAQLAKFLVESGSDGIVVAGTTGESPTLSHEEKLRLMKTVVDAVGCHAYIVGGTGSNDTTASVNMSREAEKTGIDAVMLVAPYYNKPPQEGLYQHFKKISDSISIPVILYNVPSRTQSNILPDTVARLAEIENIIALKEACGNMEQVSMVRAAVPDNFQILSGDDSLTLPMLSLGCDGVISVASHVAGEKIKSMLDAWFLGNKNEAIRLHHFLMPLFKVLFITANPIPVKAALAIKGFDVGGLRLPLIDASEQEIEKIKSVMSGMSI